MAKTVELPNSYKVYCHINRTNGKKYFGITSQNVKSRWVKGKGYMHNEHLQKAFKKYGWDGFDHIVIYQGCSKKVAELIEEDLIETFQTQDPNKGYNIRAGGNAGKHTEESKRKMSEAKKRQYADPIYRKRLSECHKGITPHNKGVPMSDEQKKKVSEAKKGIPNEKNRRKVICVELGKTFSGLIEASKETGANITKICEVCKGNRKTAGGYHWRYESEVLK